MNTDVYSCTPESVPESSNESAENMGVIKSNMASLITDQSPDIRYVVVHNKTSDTVYPALQLKSKTPGNFIMDDDAPAGTNIPSGFKLEPGEYKILTVPRYAISGKIVARTGCQYVSRYHHTDGTSSCGLYCQTGDCKQSPVTFPNSQSGVLCGILGAEPPTTSVEFSFPCMCFGFVPKLSGARSRSNDRALFHVLRTCFTYFVRIWGTSHLGWPPQKANFPV